MWLREITDKNSRRIRRIYFQDGIPENFFNRSMENKDITASLQTIKKKPVYLIILFRGDVIYGNE